MRLSSLAVVVQLLSLTWFVSGFCSDFNSSVCQGRATCPKCVSVSWFERKPYVYREANSTKGILPDVLNMMLNECCGKNTSCWHVHHSDPIQNPRQLLFGSSGADIQYPVIVGMDGGSAREDNLIGLIPPSSIAFVVPKGKKGSFPMKLMKAVFEAWPILIFTLLLSILAGIILWVMEVRVNPEEFPRTFIRGSWEGFWWAFVSMTTVGYGDRAPRSLLGRVFAVCWILLGICIVSIFTATLTTSLTTISLDTKIDVTGSKIGVLERSIELYTAMQQQADIKVYLSIHDIREALDNKEIVGALFDKYMVGHYAPLFPNEFFKVDKVLSQNKLSYGAVVNNTELKNCFNQVLHQDRFILYTFIKSELSLQVGGHKEAIRNSQSIFDPTGDLFYPSLWACIILVVIIVMLGMIAEFFYFRPSKCVRKQESYDLENELKERNKLNGISSSSNELDKQMMEEIQVIFKKYQDKNTNTTQDS